MRGSIMTEKYVLQKPVVAEEYSQCVFLSFSESGEAITKIEKYVLTDMFVPLEERKQEIRELAEKLQQQPSQEEKVMYSIQNNISNNRAFRELQDIQLEKFIDAICSLVYGEGEQGE